MATGKKVPAALPAGDALDAIIGTLLNTGAYAYSTQKTLAHDALEDARKLGAFVRWTADSPHTDGYPLWIVELHTVDGGAVCEGDTFALAACRALGELAYQREGLG